MQAFSPDIAVVPESSSTPAIARRSLLAEAVPHVWTGPWPNKGLGIYGRPGSTLVRREVNEGHGAHALADILDRHAEHLATGRTVVAGDINCSGQSSPDSFPEFFQALLDRHGLVSAYHHHTGHAFGEEANPTLYWQHKRNKPYHCDVILIPRKWKVHDVHVGDYDTWCVDVAPARSDHVPVVARVSPDPTSAP